MSVRAEQAFTFRSGSRRLFGIRHAADVPRALGVLILVGGPQYRVGSHRMFVAIARELARQGYPAMRFDFSGMGDSEGSFPGFERLNDDVRAALDDWTAASPEVERFVLLGLCDGATAAAYYAPTDRRVAGAVLLNPWVHTAAGEAKTFLWHYYPRRALQADFWRGLLAGRVALGASLRDFGAKLGRTLARRLRFAEGSSGNFVARLRDALAKFDGRVLVVASANDFTASEFTDLWSTDPSWRSVRESASFVTIAAADHTLSDRDDLRQFCASVCDWLRAEFRAIV